jgi:hypothetical protein
MAGVSLQLAPAAKPSEHSRTESLLPKPSFAKSEPVPARRSGTGRLTDV